MSKQVTSDAVLDALAKMIADCGAEIKFGFSGSVDWNNDEATTVRAWNEERGVEYFPATRDGLIRALAFAGLDVESASNGEGGEK